MVTAVVVMVAGLAYFSRSGTRRTRVVGTIASLVVALVLGWFAWLSGTQASTTTLECSERADCRLAADAAIGWLQERKGDDMPAVLRASWAGGRTWVMAACWPAGGYVLVNVDLDTSPRASWGGAVYGSDPCARSEH